MLSVRRATLDDVEPMVAAYTAAWRSGFTYMFSAQVFEDERFDEMRRDECLESAFDDGTDTFVADLSGRVVGYVVSRSVGTDCEIDDLWVHPTSWGRGVAAALLARAEDDMRSRGGRSMTAWVPEDSPTANRFLDKLGWRPTGRTDELEMYADDNTLVEYVRQLESVDLTRGLPRPTSSLAPSPAR